MADVKWIKISTDIFNDEKFDAIRTMPDGKDIQLAWFKLLCLAGRCNENGFLMITRELPYTDEMLASNFRMEVGIVQRALTAFQKLGMVEVIDDVYMVSNWTKYQSEDSLERIREQGRARQREYRERQMTAKLLSVKGCICVYCGKEATAVDHIIPKSKNGTDDKQNLVPACKSCNSAKKDKDLVDFLNDDLMFGNPHLDHRLIQSNPQLMSYVNFDEEMSRYSNVIMTQKLSSSNNHSLNNPLSLNSDSNNTNSINIKTDISNSIELIIKAWNELSDIGIKPIRSVSSGSKRNEMLRARIREHGSDTVIEAIGNIRESDFLQGKNNRGWMITFDWFLLPGNFQKVLEGNYDKRNHTATDKLSQKFEEMKNW